MTDASKKQLSLEILKIIKTAQIQNGLRHGDYARYRSYCTKRMHRIRKSIKFLHGARYRKKELELQHITSSRHLELLLMTAERCWALAMLRKEDTDNYMAKFHAVRRLAKGAVWAEKLSQFCNAVADDRTMIEAESYAAWFKGSVLLEQSDWTGARALLMKAKIVYEELGKVGAPEMQELCTERVTEIEPPIRYCNFSLQQQHGQIPKLADAEVAALEALKSKLESVVNDIRKKEATTMREVVWKGQRIPIRNETTRQCILSANELSIELAQAGSEEQKIHVYDKILAQYIDALRSNSAELSSAKSQAQKKLTTTNTSNAKSDIQTLEALQEYITQAKLEKGIEKTLMSFNLQEAKFNITSEGPSTTSTDASDKLVRLCETLMENFSELISHTDSSDTKSQKTLAAKLLSYKALRCYFLAISYSISQKWNEAMTLFKRTQSHIDDALSHHKECLNADEALVSKLQSYKSKAEGKEALCLVQCMQPVQTQQKKVEVKGDEPVGPLLDNLSVFSDSFIQKKSFVEFPPKFEPIVCKPVLYDIAYSSCTYPDLSQKKKAPTGKGLFGSWWG